LHARQPDAIAADMSVDPNAVGDEARVARHRCDRVAKRFIETERIEDRRVDEGDQRNACAGSLSVVALAPLASGQVGGTLLRSRSQLTPPTILAKIRQSLNGHFKNVVLVVELGPQPTANPTGSDAVEEHLLVGLEIDALLQDDDRPP